MLALMARQVVGVDAQRKDRSLVPAERGLEAKLKAEPVLLLWRRLIHTATEEARQCRYGQPTDTAILARWWIEQQDPADAKGVAATFDRACRLLGEDPEAERAKILNKLNAAWLESALMYWRRRLALRRDAVLSVAREPSELGYDFALLLVSEAQYEDTAGISRPDPPARVAGRVSGGAPKASRRGQGRGVPG